MKLIRELPSPSNTFKEEFLNKVEKSEYEQEQMNKLSDFLAKQSNEFYIWKSYTRANVAALEIL